MGKIALVFNVLSGCYYSKKTDEGNDVEESHFEL